MKKSYIANDKEAVLLHSGQQTAIIVPMKVQPVDCSHIHKMSDEICEWRNSPMELLVFDGIGAACKYCGNGVNYGGEYEIKSPYALHQPVYVREKWHKAGYWQHPQTNESVSHVEDEPWFWCRESLVVIPQDTNMTFLQQSPVTMPKGIARTWFVPVEVQAIRVRDLTQEQCRCLPIKPQPHRPAIEGCRPHADNSINRDCFVCPSKHYIVQKLGQQAWDENHFIWYYKIKKA